MDAGPENQVRRHVARQGILPVVDFMDPKNGGVPICSMYGIFTCILVIFRANAGKYSIHGAYGVPPWIGHLHIFGKTQMIQMDMRATLSGRMVNPEQVQFFSNEKYCLSIVFLLPLYASYLVVRMPRTHCLSSAS